ncbi:unnamed protein product [Owenia fusiformis]|uniref:Transmembrane protein 230 n=1 Tax=Owenia fusiformis TaxID=6347 RepID=A0A8J1T4Z2_OWEFU|nr:unnamed protein product [Owenia fusiformis]
MMPKRSIVKEAKGSSVQYHKLTRSDDGFIDTQFEKPPPKVPYKAIALATVLFLVGTILLVIGALLLSGRFVDPKYNDRTWPVLIIGIIMFLPGIYHVRIAYCAYMGYQGYDFDDIPEFE